MKSCKGLFWTIPILLLFTILLSMGAPEARSWTGLIAVKGNEPFTFLALTDLEGHQWRLSGDPVKQLWETAQGRWVRVTGQFQGNDGIRVETWAWAPDEAK